MRVNDQPTEKLGHGFNEHDGGNQRFPAKMSIQKRFSEGERLDSGYGFPLSMPVTLS